MKQPLGALKWRENGPGTEEYLIPWFSIYLFETANKLTVSHELHVVLLSENRIL
jgi:hypothetical protein